MKKLWLIPLCIVIVLIIGVSTVGGSDLPSASTSLVDQQTNNIAVQNYSAINEDLSLKFENPDRAPQQQTENQTPDAVLTVDSAEVFTCSGSGDFELADSGLDLEEGISVRTGKDGAATINFGEEVELILAANSQIKIKKYQMLDETTIQLHIELLIGDAFFKVNYMNDDNLMVDFKLISPVTLVENTDMETNKAFSGVAKVTFPELQNLSPEELENQIATTYACFNNGCGSMCVDGNCSYCQDFSDFSKIKFNLTDNTGQMLVHYVDQTGHQQATLQPGQTFSTQPECGTNCDDLWESYCAVLNDLSNGNPPSQTDIQTISDGLKPGPTPPVTPGTNCGDGVCNIYDNENKNTCPADCGN